MKSHALLSGPVLGVEAALGENLRSSNKFLTTAQQSLLLTMEFLTFINCFLCPRLKISLHQICSVNDHAWYQGFPSELFFMLQLHLQVSKILRFSPSISCRQLVLIGFLSREESLQDLWLQMAPRALCVRHQRSLYLHSSQKLFAFWQSEPKLSSYRGCICKCGGFNSGAYYTLRN